MKNFELFMCCLGNGVIVCNKAVKKEGDYKHIAHISNCGKITWYVNHWGYVPDDALLKIVHCANVQYKKWEKWLASMPEPQQYEKLLNVVPLDIMRYAMNLGGGLERKIYYLKKVCYENSYF